LQIALIAGVLVAVSAWGAKPAPGICPLQERELKKAIHGSLYGPEELDRLVSELAALEKRHGTCVRADFPTPDTAVLRYADEDTRAHLRLTRDLRGRLVAVDVKELEFLNDSFGKISSSLPAGNRGFYVEKNGKEKLFGLNESKRLSVGESVSVFILEKYREQVAKKKISPRDVVGLRESDKAFSLGLLSEWPAGSFLTLDSLLRFLFRFDDLVAFDLLVRKLGPQRFKELAGPFSIFPFYRDLHLLLHLPDEKAGSLVDAGSLKRLVSLVDSKLAAEPLEEPRETAAKVGWFAPVKGLCASLFRMKDDPLLHRSSGFLSRERWESFAQLRGTFPGVISYTQLAKNKKSGDWFCVSLTAERKELEDDATAVAALDRAFRLLESLP
jgi:hypothetical protein